MANNLNIGSVVSPDVLKTISSAAVIKTFGDQLINKAKKKVISAVLGKAQEIKDQIQEIITLKIKIWSDHGTEMKRLEILLKEKQITQEQYNKAVAKEEEAYQNKLADLEDLDLKLKEDLANIIADPYRKIKDKLNKRKLKRQKRKNRNRAERAKARRALIKKLAINAAKTLAPILALQLANKFAAVLSQRAQLEKLVDQVNAYIDQANTPETIAIATNLRNNAIKLINNSISKLTNLEKTIAQISLYITIFTAVVAILSAIPIPTAVPPGIGIPVNVITRIVKSLEKAAKLIVSLSVVTAIAVTILESEISKLNELIERLKAVNQLLDSKSSLNLNEQELADLTNAFLPTGNDFEMYKGFKFAIKEEQTLGAQQAVIVKGNKRRYAVAINRDGTEILKSDNSFTLDPNDLIDQLKLIIDQRNLQG
jgi:hypothetical protein